MTAVSTRLPWLVLCCVAGLACSSDQVATTTGSIVLPTGFQVEILATGLRNPTAMDLAPDGRIFVAEQTGAVRVVKNDVLLAAPFVQLTVDSANERGLVGLTLDPAFASNGFVYVFYTTAQGGTHNRVSRFTASGDAAVPGSERILVDFPALSDAANHNSGALDFGADGKLYVAHGDNANTDLAQNLNHPFGKILRFDADGGIPTDNPFYGTSSGLARAIWAFGVRNTFTFAFHPTTGVLHGNDVGGGDPEEINAIVRGGNFGHGGGPLPRIAPVYSYPRTEGRCAITGGTFYAPPVSQFPALYAGRYFFADYCGGEIWSMNADGTGVTSFARESNGELSNPVDLDVGADGSLYFLQRNNGAKIGRIFFGGGAECTSDAQCSDGNACNGIETCETGSCAGGAAPVCNDGNPCTTDTCSPGSGCSFPSNGTCAGDRLEAETAAFTGATLGTEAEASAGAYVDGGEGATVRWTVTSSGGSATLGFAIRAPSGVRVMGVFVNGTRVGAVTTTTLRPTWSEPTVTAALLAGANTVELRDSENSAEPDIDYLAVTGGSAPTCGDGTCGGAETCGSCPADCGPCDARPAPLHLTRISDTGDWSNVAGLTDGNLIDKVSTGVSPACLEYALDGPATVTSARVLEDNAGAWSVSTWTVQVDRGSGYVDLFAATDTPNPMPAWNEVDPPDAAGVTRVRVCLSHGGVVEAAELEIWGVTGEVVCGDRRCSSTETCGACPWDCGTCPGGELGLDERPANPGCVASDPFEAPPPLLSASPCLVAVANPPVYADGVVPYALAEPFWSDGAVKTRHLALPDGATLAVGADGDLTLPPGAVTIKSFQFQGRMIETRFFVRFSDGSYGAWTYAWNDAETEATLVDPAVGAARTLPGDQLWRYPTRSQCFDCHASAAGFSLGLEVRQLDSDLRYPATGRTANQLRTLDAIGMLSGATAPRTPLPAHDDERASLQLRAEAYLHVNCSNCHRPGGTGHGSADYRYDTPFAQKNICDRRSVLDAYPGLDLVEPGAHDASVVWLRTSQRAQSFMPPIGSTVADGPGAAMLGRWIDGLAACPAP
jgi:uncharacterized repeat protein (TIGR03806 family)